MNEQGHSRRHADRYRIDLRVVLDNGVGLTRDVCTTGVYFTSEQQFVPGAQLSFTIVLDSADAETSLRMNCNGEVVRTELLGASFGVGAKISEYTIET